ncbi:MAG: hypothetical protein J0M08_00125 [Bacteroidetes bacterium]|nr:hypothetical protein [Bacteroidota bacterium]
MNWKNSLFYFLAFVFMSIIYSCKPQLTSQVADFDSFFITHDTTPIRVTHIQKEDFGKYKELDSFAIKRFNLQVLPNFPNVEYYSNKSLQPLAIGKFQISNKYTGYLIGLPHEYNWMNIVLKLYDTEKMLVSDSSYWVGAYFGDGGAEYFLESKIEFSKNAEVKIKILESSTYLDPVAEEDSLKKIELSEHEIIFQDEKFILRKGSVTK